MIGNDSTREKSFKQNIKPMTFSSTPSPVQPQLIRYLLGIATTITVLSSSLFNVAQAANKSADFLFIVDESGSMSGEHAWLQNMVGSLDTALQTKGLRDNRFGLIGFGGMFYPGSPFARPIDLDLSTPGLQQFGTANMFANASSRLMASGAYEDGYQAIDFGLNNYSIRDNAVLNVVLITDEDRDYGLQRSLGFNFNSILNQLQGKNALLNAVVNFNFRDSNGRNAIGVDSQQNALIADGQGGFSQTTGGVATSGFGTTKNDYINLAWATGNSTIGGAAWNLNLLRAGGNSAKSFTNAFVEIKAKEASLQRPVNPSQDSAKVPEPSMGLGLFMLGIVSRMLLRNKQI